MPIGDYLMIGASADYIAVPSLDIPASGRHRLPTSAINLSSPSYGFAISVRP